MSHTRMKTEREIEGEKNIKRKKNMGMEAQEKKTGLEKAVLVAISLTCP